MTTGHGVETWEFLTEEPTALSSYALAYVALTASQVRKFFECGPYIIYMYITIHLFIFT